ncbi:helix-turn-helix domain-containing protein [Nostoc sp.]|uniref:helix-turn-helix domain-containing protein n=1 Tax=Nostoc sp. TaxID=1180 RepID=UPI002FF9B199
MQLSQLAISHAIATLEEKLGVPLFPKGLSIGFASFHTLWTHSSQPLEDFSNPNKYC